MSPDAERAELIKAVQELDGEYKPPEKELVATIKLEPITLAQAEDEQTDKVNFG